MSKEERDLLEETRKADEWDVEKFSELGCSKMTIATPGDKWWPQSAKQERDKATFVFVCTRWWNEPE